MDNTIIVLVIDDEIHMRRLVGRILTGVGCQVLEAGTGQQALDILATAKALPQVITCDIYMPDLDGFGFLQKIKADTRFAYIPVVMLTALGQVEEAYKAKEMGASDFITKPFSETGLIDIVQKYADGSEK